MANKKEIQRTERIEFILSKEEKELIWEYAKSMEMKPSRLIRNIVLMDAESNLRFINVGLVKAYKRYLKITDPEFLQKINTEE